MNAPRSIEWSGDSRTLVTLSGDGQKTYDLRSNLLVQSSRVVYATLAVDAHGTRMVGTTDHGNKLHLVDLATMRPLRTMEGGAFAVTRFSPDGTIAAAGLTDGRTLLYSGTDGTDVASLPAGEGGGTVRSLAFDASGRRLAVVHPGHVQIYDRPSNAPGCKVVMQDPGGFGMGVSLLSAAFDPAGNELVVSRNEGTNEVWDVRACKRKSVLMSPQDKESETTRRPRYTLEMLGYLAGLHEVLVQANGPDRSVELLRWNLDTNSTAPYASVGARFLVAASLSPNGRTLVVASLPDQVRLYEAATGADLGPVGPRASAAIPLAIDETKDELFVADERGKSVDVIDLRQAQKVGAFPVPKSAKVLAMTGRTRGMVVATTAERKQGYSTITDTTLTLVDAATEKSRVLAALPNTSVELAVFSNDGKTIVARAYVSTSREERERKRKNAKPSSSVVDEYGAYHLLAFDAITGKKRWDLKVDGEPERIVAAGGVLLTAEKDLVVRDLATGSERGKLVAAPDPGKDASSQRVTHRTVTSIDLAPDGKRALSSGSRGEVFAWNVDTRTVEKAIAPRGEELSEPLAYFVGGGAEIVVVAYDGQSTRYDAKTFAPTPGVRAHDGQAFFATTSATGRWSASFGYDLAVRIDRREATHGTVRMVRSASGDYAFLAPSNAYLAPKSALGSLGFRVGTRGYPFDSFDAALNRPADVLKELGAPSRAVAAAADLTQRRIKRLGLAQAPTGVDEVPDIAITTSAIPRTTATRTLPLTVHATGWSQELDRIEVFVNEVPAGVVDLRSRHTKTIDESIDVVLGVGPNRVQVSAWNDRGLESLRETVSVVLDAPAAKPDLHVVVVGVSKYQVGRLDLEYAAKDAHDVAAFFKSHNGRFANVKVTELVDHDATRARLGGLGQALAQTKVDDEVVVFLAGHGFLGAKDEYFFAPHDLDPKGAATANATGFPFAELEKLLAAAPARRKLVLMDTCHSGEADDGATAPLASGVKASTRGLVLDAAPTVERPNVRDSRALLAETFADVRRGSGAVVLASAGGQELALEAGAQKNGLFTYALIEGLTNAAADADKDGQVRVSELRDYVLRRVATLSGGRQHPTSRRENVTLDFPVF